ncbi:MAG TPA: hypothetical protein VLL25_04900, partial [Acidimicrobiales bacterium]|nr:hypothetical protein [Acidimicrobiales bacterium]
MAATGLIPDLLEVPVPVGGRALIVSELHLTGSANAGSTLATTQVAQAIESWTGPGVLIFNGGGLELLTSRPVDGNAALAAYPRLVSAVKAFAARPGRRVLYLPGARDSRAAWDRDTATALRNGFGAEVALAAELRLDTGAGPRLVRVEPGHRFDPLTCPGDPRNPADSPLGHHLVCEVLPALRGDDSTQPVSDRGWLAGLEALDDPATFPRFLASRLAYRRLGRHAWWLLLPFIVAVLLRLPFAVVRRAHEHVVSATRIGVYVGVATIVDLLLVAVVATVVIRRTWRALAGVALNRAADREDPNGPARGLARELVTSGHAGLITGHTRRPELTRLGSGFYANTGCVGEVVSETPSRLASLGIPSLFLAHRQVAWVELEAGNDLHVRLLYGQEDLPGATWIERLLARPSPRPSTVSGREPETAEVVAAFPQGASWPPPVDVAVRLRRVRRVSASLVAFAGIVSMVSA